jgi:hypothetical protein
LLQRFNHGDTVKIKNIIIEECMFMKKVILGTGLIICGVMGYLANIIYEAILFASPNEMLAHGTNKFYYAIISMIVGIVLNIFGFLEDRKKIKK